MTASLSRRAFKRATTASFWEEVWEAGPYYDRLSKLLEAAEHYAIFVGWQIDSRVVLGGGETFKQKLIRICEAKPDFHFYFLIWDHAYFYVLEREFWQGRVWEEVHSRIHFVFDNRHPFGGSHHEKVCLIDGKTAFCGGIDLCDERWDSPEHLYHDRRRSLNHHKESHGPYHDLAVQVEGPICAEIQAHIRRRWKRISSIPFPAPMHAPGAQPGSQKDQKVYFSRTFTSQHQGEVLREVEFLFRDLISQAEKIIVLEGQYYWSKQVNDLIISQMLKNRGTGFKVYLILAEIDKLKSLSHTMSGHERALLSQLSAAARFTETQLTVGYPYTYDPATPPQAPRPIFIHSKILIIDDRYLSIGSANFAARALRLDTEINLTLEATSARERLHIRRVTDQVLSHWQSKSVSLRYFQPLSYPLLKSTPHFPWSSFLDPALPWLYPLKHRIRMRIKRYPDLSALILLCGWCTSTWAAGLLAHLRGSNQWILAAVLASGWIIPIPFTLFCIGLSYFRGGQEAVTLVIPAFWICSIWGYFAMRFLPKRFFRVHKLSFLFRALSRRTFADLLKAVAAPWISFRTKIAYEGLYRIPVPWLFFLHGLVIPGFYYVLCITVGNLR